MEKNETGKKFKDIVASTDVIINELKDNVEKETQLDKKDNNSKNYKNNKPNDFDLPIETKPTESKTHEQIKNQVIIDSNINTKKTVEPLKKSIKFEDIKEFKDNTHYTYFIYGNNGKRLSDVTNNKIYNNIISPSKFVKLTLENVHELLKHGYTMIHCPTGDRVTKYNFVSYKESLESGELISLK